MNLTKDSRINNFKNEMQDINIVAETDNYLGYMISCEDNTTYRVVSEFGFPKVSISGTKYKCAVIDDWEKLLTPDIDKVENHAKKLLEASVFARELNKKLLKE